MELVSYQHFGTAFVDAAITPGRLEEAVAAIAGPTVEVGPIGVGPGDAASVVARGTINAPTAKAVAPEPDGTRRFVVSIPVELKLTVKVSVTTHRFDATVIARLHLAARTATAPLSLVIDIAPPEVSDLEVDVRASGVVAKVLGRLGNVDNKIRKEVVGFIGDRLKSDATRAATVIDISHQIENVWHEAVSLPETP